ncbi:hypothetical protein AALA83_14490 [Oscillospiraceae bacterium 44-5]
MTIEGACEVVFANSSAEAVFDLGGINHETKIIEYDYRLGFVPEHLAYIGTGLGHKWQQRVCL